MQAQKNRWQVPRPVVLEQAGVARAQAAQAARRAQLFPGYLVWALASRVQAMLVRGMATPGVLVRARPVQTQGPPPVGLARSAAWRVRV